MRPLPEWETGHIGVLWAGVVWIELMIFVFEPGAALTEEIFAFLPLVALMVTWLWFDRRRPRR